MTDVNSIDEFLKSPLCKVIYKILDQNINATALIACTERSSTTINCFEEALTKEKLTFLVVARGSFSPSENLLCSDVLHQKTRIYNINKRL